MLVPTIDTVRFSYLLELNLDVGRSVLYSGITGVGKVSPDLIKASERSSIVNSSSLCV